ncbi:histidine phosphatase family protein [Curtobacterium sp. Csp1]|uniref:histidine phosphatase family protein n=1 Tax=Curtobacterium sp. Csp1 TaxID=2495429 RepID=UPI0034A0BB5A
MEGPPGIGHRPSVGWGACDSCSSGTARPLRLPDALADRGIERLFVSTLVRTQQTAAPLAAALGTEPVVLPGLREIEAGDTQGKRDRVSVQLYISTVHGWSAGDRASRMPGGESGEEFFARYEGAIRQVEATGVAVAAVVSHGAAIRTWASARRARGLDRRRVAPRRLGG